MWDNYFNNTKKKPAPSEQTLYPAGVLANLCRVSAELKVRSRDNVVPLQPTVLEARLILCDFRANWVGLFVPELIQPGTEIAFTLEQPTRFFCHGRVDSCNFRTDSSRVFSQKAFDYRLGFTILHRSAEEAEMVQRFVDELNRAQTTPLGVFELQKRSAA
jgi:hypothetical protein